MNKTKIDAIVNHMVGIVHHHKLTLMKHYPRDLLEHDRRVLERVAVPGASVAWIVGHYHTDMTLIGIHKDANAYVGHYLKATEREDKFYRIDFGVGKLGFFRFTELDSAAFAALQNTRIAYRASGAGPEFDLFDGDRKVGRCLFKHVSVRDRRYEAHISPAPHATKLDRVALYEWLTRAIYSEGTYFAGGTVQWHEATETAELEAA